MQQFLVGFSPSCCVDVSVFACKWKVLEKKTLPATSTCPLRTFLFWNHVEQFTYDPECVINANELFVACLNSHYNFKKWMIGLSPAWVTALAVHNFSSERLLIHSAVLIWKGLMRENTYWLIIVLRKGHAFEMNETNGGPGGRWENAQQLNYDAAGGGAGRCFEWNKQHIQGS